MPMLTDSARYRDFITERDQALEHLYRMTQLRVTSVLKPAFTDVLHVVSFQYHHLPAGDYFTARRKQVMRQLDQQLEQIFERAEAQILPLIYKMRKNTFLLTYAGEGEAIYRVTGRLPTSLAKERLHKAMNEKAPSDGKIHDRVTLSFQKLKRKVLNAVELSFTLEDSIQDTLDRVGKALPQSKRVTRPRLLQRPKKLREREIDPRDHLEVGQTNDEDWNALIKDYKDTFIPTTRGPKDVFDVEHGEPETEEWYGWEVEQEMTQDFVTTVRTAEREAGTDQGIDEFVWIEIVDDKTDECCLWRGGLTTTQIERELEDNRQDDDCDSSVPPAHFNCRCRLAPVTGEITPVEIDLGDFNAWLMEPNLRTTAA